jgi:hypothetical protein
MTCIRSLQKCVGPGGEPGLADTLVIAQTQYGVSQSTGPSHS